MNPDAFYVFSALKLPPGRTTVMHLVARETLPEPNSHGEELSSAPCFSFFSRCQTIKKNVKLSLALIPSCINHHASSVLSCMLDVIHSVTTSSQTHDRRVDASV